jgi:hypothetical protein
VHGSKSLHRAFSNARRPDPPSLPKTYQAGVSGGAPLTAERGTRGVRLPPHRDNCRKISTRRSAQLGLSLVWLASLRHCRGGANYRPHSAPHRPTLRGADRVTASAPWCPLRRALARRRRNLHRQLARN